MINVTVYVEQQVVYRALDIRDMQDMPTEGQDIICAAVSVLVINTVNSIDAVYR